MICLSHVSARCRALTRLYIYITKAGDPPGSGGPQKLNYGIKAVTRIVTSDADYAGYGLRLTLGLRLSLHGARMGIGELGSMRLRLIKVRYMDHGFVVKLYGFS